MTAAGVAPANDPAGLVQEAHRGPVDRDARADRVRAAVEAVAALNNRGKAAESPPLRTAG